MLTEAVISNLTNLSLTGIDLFTFAATDTTIEKRCAESCKTYPGNSLYPSAIIWNVLDLLLGGSLIKNVPLPSVCYDTWGKYDAAQCQYITDQWANVSLHIASPSDVMYQLWAGSTCLPPDIETNGPEGCELGGFPAYIVNHNDSFAPN